MSAAEKKCCKIFLLTDYEEEEKWLREMANSGWMLKSAAPFVYTFEKIEPEDIVFQLDFQNTKVEPEDEYMQMMQDYGWTYLTSLNNYRYLYKPASEEDSEAEIYTDNESKYEMLKRIFRNRILLLIAVFCLCVLPAFIRVVTGEIISPVYSAICIAVMILYVLIFIKVGTGYRRLFRKYRPESR